MSDPLTRQQLTFSAVLLLANRMQTTYDSQLGTLTLKQWLALAVVVRLPQPIRSASVVAEALGTTHQNTTKLLTSLEKAGLVQLASSPTDRRARQVLLTAAAREYAKTYDAQSTRLLHELFAGVSDVDVATALRVLEAMSFNLTGESLIPPGEEI